MLLYIAVAAVFALTAAVTLLLTAPTNTPAMRLAHYTTSARRGSPGLAVETQTARERLVTPLLRPLLNLIASATPRRAREAIARDLIMAGSRTSPTVFLGIQTLSTFGVPIFVFAQLLHFRPVSLTDWGLLGLSIIIGRRLPRIRLKRQMRQRQRAIDRQLPYALDLMVACLDAGLSLDASLAKVMEQSSGPLAVEIESTLQEMTLGRDSAEAMRALGERTGAHDLKRLTSSIVQAERMGIAIAEAMRVLARESRVRRRQQAEEMARKAPIKMIPVLIFFIMPALMVVIMAPAVLTLMQVFPQVTP